MLRSKVHLLLLGFFVSSCGSDSSSDISSEKSKDVIEYYQILGPTQGTSYHITYLDSAQRNLKPIVDSLLNLFDSQLSQYDSTSVISRWNKDKSVQVGPEESTAWLYDCILKSQKLSVLTNDAFNPLVSYCNSRWEDSAFICPKFSEAKDIGDNYLMLSISDSDYFLDLNAMAQGYSVDVLSNHFRNLGVKNYMIEIGGEIRTLGNNPNGTSWNLGIDKPVLDSKPGDDLAEVVSLSGQSLATSGNYRKYVEEDGKLKGHTLDPETGKSVMNNLLSVTVISNECYQADAIATAIMVMGKEKALDWKEKHQDAQVEFMMIYSDTTSNMPLTYYSDGFKSYIRQ